MRRAVLAIGCDTYDHVRSLEGAEFDATRLYGELVKPEVGDNDPVKSILLLSPTLSEVRDAFSRVVYSDDDLESLTIYFAGHGAIDVGGFYMLMRDSRDGRLSTSAYWLSEIFATIASKPPMVTSIILDACFSGGLANDVHVLVRPEIQGDAGSPAVILLAMASRDEFAHETGEGGVATNALLECIDGRVYVQQHNRALSLTEIGAALGERLGSDPRQHPRYWALNVHQRHAFCRNPHFQANLDATFKHWSPRGFIDGISPLLASHLRQPLDQVADVERLMGGLVSLSQGSLDAFLEAEVRATAAVSLLPYCASTIVAKFVEEQCLEVARCSAGALSKTAAALRRDEFALLSAGAGIADLYVLPLRIWSILGWSAASYFVLRRRGEVGDFPTDDLQTVLSYVAQHYNPVLLSDDQASAIAIALSGLVELGLIEEGEYLASLAFNSALSVQGRVASHSIKKEQLLAYMVLRGQRIDGILNADEVAADAELVASPVESIAVLLRMAPHFELSEVFDESMDLLDHLDISIFVPEDYGDFSENTIENGTNFTFTIGHGVWTVADLMATWPHTTSQQPSVLAVRDAALFASLLFPDRVPWYIVPASQV